YCEAQALGEQVPVTGTGMNLNYVSNRVPGRTDSYTVRIPIVGAQVPMGITNAHLGVEIAGQRFHTDFFQLSPNQTYSFTWDGRDAYGRVVQGTQRARIFLAYNYPGVYYSASAFESAFGSYSGSGGSSIAVMRGPCLLVFSSCGGTIILGQTWYVNL